MKLKTITIKKNGVVSLGIGTILSQFINLLSQPILTRLVTPEDLGIYSYIISMATLIIPIASLKLETLIVTEKDDKEADYITDISLFLVTIVSLTYMCIICISLLSNKNSFNDIGFNALWIPAIVFTNGIRFIFISYNNRYKNYKIISKNFIVREGSMSGIQLIGAFLHSGISGQVAGYCLSPLFGLKTQAQNYIKTIGNRENISLKKVKKVLLNSKNQVLYQVPGQFINSFSYTLITLSLTYMFTPLEVGLYSISYRILNLPLVLITNNVSKIFLQKMSEKYKNQDSVWKFYIIVIKYLVLISSVVFPVLAVLSPALCSFIFGSEYYEAGKYISVLCIMYAFRFIASSIMESYVIFNKQYINVFFQTLLVIAGILVYIITGLFNLNIYSYFTMISLFYGIIYIVIIVNIGFICKRIG